MLTMCFNVMDVRSSNYSAINLSYQKIIKYLGGTLVSNKQLPPSYFIIN